MNQWRKAKRAELIARRSRFDPEQRRRWNEVMTERLVRGFPELAGKTIGFC
jgi:hypothetical protein